jgi:ribosomal protein S18 acetylase RimI-like enzyme
MSIRILGKDDVDFAVSLTEQEGWFYTARELEFMLRMNPEGSFVFEEDVRLGFATCVTYGRTGVLGHLIVSKEGRGRKIGDSLLRAAVDYMSSKEVESMLVLATQKAVRLYERHGFEIRDEITCMHSRLDNGFDRAPSASCTLITESDLDEVVEIDQRLFGDDRDRLIRMLYREAPQHSFKIEKEGVIQGYILARPDHIGYNLGPWICLTGEAGDAEALFRTALSTLGNGKLYSGSFSSNRAALKIMEETPKIDRWRIPLMIRGKARYNTNTSKVFGIAAFELG